MATIKDSAENYKIKTTKNIADLSEVTTDLELLDDEFEFTDSSGKVKSVKQKVINLNGENFRVPTSVLQQLKVLLEDNPKLLRFKVKKSGSGKDDTRYQVIPLG